jgi:hypothetical protein
MSGSLVNPLDALAFPIFAIGMGEAPVLGGFVLFVPRFGDAKATDLQGAGLCDAGLLMIRRFASVEPNLGQHALAPSLALTASPAQHRIDSIGNHDHFKTSGVFFAGRAIKFQTTQAPKP